jgi:hypothetical protein
MSETSVFYQLGQAVAIQISNNNSVFFGTANTFTATQTFADIVISSGNKIEIDGENLGDLDDLNAGLNS